MPRQVVYVVLGGEAGASAVVVATLAYEDELTGTALSLEESVSLDVLAPPTVLYNVLEFSSVF